MKLTNEQAKHLHDKLAVAKNPEEAAKVAKEFGIEVPAEALGNILENVGSIQTLSDNALEKINGGEWLDIPEDTYEAIRVAYDQGGPQLAFPVCIYFIPSPLCNEIIYGVEEERRKKGLLSGK